MTVVVTNDFIQINAADALSGWVARGSMGMLGLDTTSQVEGISCIAPRVTSGVGDVTVDHEGLGSLGAAIADDGGSFTDETTAANNATTNDMTLLPAVPVSGDTYLFGNPNKFGRILLEVGTIGVGTYTITWEYFDSTGTWSALSGVTDVTGSFKTSQTGGLPVRFTVPADWAKTTINSQGPFYYIRGRVDGGTVTTVPIGTQVFMDTDYTNKHLYAWLRAAAPFDTLANGGCTIKISGATLGDIDFGEWDVGGSDVGIKAIKGWQRMTVDMLRPFTAVNGTVPLISNVRTSGSGANFSAGNGMEIPAVDSIDAGTLITVGGGTSSLPGLMSEIVSNDIQLGKGFFKNAGGAFYANVKVRIGNSASASSEFRDANQVLIFESDLLITASLLGFFFVGNGTGTNVFRLGFSAGSGVDKEASGGGLIKAAGAGPFRIDASDQNMDEVSFFGVAVTGPPDLKADPVRNFKVEDDSNSTFVDDTRDANDAGAADAQALPTTQAIDDASYYGHDERFYELNIDLGTAKGGTWTGTWEYHNGSAWVALTDLTDGTSNYATTGPVRVNFSIPDDWAKFDLDGDNRYWIRFRISAFTSSGTAPVIDECSVAMAGDIRLEDSTVEAIRCTITNMGSVRVRGGAFLKKSILTDSVVTAKHAALDLGSADPATDTVRDLTIQNSEKGILLKGTSTGTTTYNLRNIKYGNNNIIAEAWQEDNSLAAFVDEVDDANSGAANDVQFFPVSPAVNDAFYIGDRGLFDEVSIIVGTAGAGTYTVTWQYWNGTAWTALSGVSDGTSGFKTVGTNLLTFTKPTNWAETSVSTGEDMFFIRALRDSGTETTRPLGTQLEVPGDIRVDFPSAATVVINILEGGGVPQIDNVNGSTVTVVNAVTLTVNVTDVAGAAVQAAQVAIYDSSDVALMNEDTTAGGVAAETFDFVSDEQVTVRVRKSSPGATRYLNFLSVATITSSGLTVFVTLIVDQAAKHSTTIDLYDQANQNGAASLDNIRKFAGQGFTGDGDPASRAVFFIKRTNALTGNYRFHLYAHTGTFGSTGTPTGNALATTRDCRAADLLTSYQAIGVVFSAPLPLVNGTNYFIVIEYQDGTASNTLDVGADSAAPTHAGNSADAPTAGTPWATQSADLVFAVQGTP